MATLLKPKIVAAPLGSCSENYNKITNQFCKLKRKGKDKEEKEKGNNNYFEFTVFNSKSAKIRIIQLTSLFLILMLSPVKLLILNLVLFVSLSIIPIIAHLDIGMEDIRRFNIKHRLPYIFSSLYNTLHQYPFRHQFNEPLILEIFNLLELNWEVKRSTQRKRKAAYRLDFFFHSFLNSLI